MSGDAQRSKCKWSIGGHLLWLHKAAVTMSDADSILHHPLPAVITDAADAASRVLEKLYIVLYIFKIPVIMHWHT